jgi:acetyltransferase-like isoleucine patch superfamily enzyme
MKSVMLYLYSLISFFIPETRLFKVKVFLLRIAGLKIGKGVKICSSAKFIGSGKVFIGDYSWVGANVFICSNSSGEVKIGSKVDIGPKVTITNGTHYLSSGEDRVAGEGRVINVSIGDGSWVGMCSVLTPGSDVGNSVMIAAGSVVVGLLPAHSVCAGIPCKKIRRLE